jgi:hypothetical protein
MHSYLFGHRWLCISPVQSRRALPYPHSIPLASAMANIPPSSASPAPLLITRDVEDGATPGYSTFSNVSNRVITFHSSMDHSPLSNILFAIIGLFIVILGVAFITIFLAVILALSGSLELLAGHAILRAWAYEGYANYSLASSVKLGAVGGVVFGLGFALVSASCVRIQAQGALGPFVHAVLYGGGVGFVGSAILAKHGLEGLILDPKHAAVAGAVGGVAIGLGWILVLFLILVVVTIVQILRTDF